MVPLVCKVVSLPTRDGNFLHLPLQTNRVPVVSLPTRDGNQLTALLTLFVERL